MGFLRIGKSRKGLALTGDALKGVKHLVPRRAT